MALIGETGRESDFGQWCVACPKALTSKIDSEFSYVVAYCTVVKSAEDAGQMCRMDTRHGCYLTQCQGAGKFRMEQVLDLR